MPSSAFLLVTCSLLWWAHAVLGQQDAVTTSYNFAIMPKSIGNSFFFPVREGCQARADYHHRLSQGAIKISCEWVGPEEEDPTGAAQAEVIRAIVAARIDGSHVTDGLAISVMNSAALVEPIAEALASGMSVICFDSDAVESDRQSYVGTDNLAFGEQLGKVLLQLRPQGGQYAMLTIPGPNLEERVAGVRLALQGTSWTELPDSLTFEEGSLDAAMVQIGTLKQEHPELGAILPTYGGPMNEALTWTDFVDQHRDMTFVVADAMAHQITLMERGYADGLVGQLPYQSGEQCIDTLLSLQQQGNPPRNSESDMIFGTNLSFFLRIPLVLPDLTVDMNFLGSLRILGYTLFGIIVVADIVSTIWVVRNWNTRIVSAGQPFFLVTLALGVLIMSASIVPMGFDDENWENLDQACMAEPWLLTVGFGIIFAGLFSKLWRVDRLISSAMRFSKQRVSIRDVMLPFCVLTLINVTILICWTIFAPLHYVRQDHEGTDPWNRVISTHGSCRSAEDKNSYPFVGSLVLINFGALMLANFAAFRTRHVQTELSESRYIAITVAFMTQAALVGLPVLLLVDDEPQAHYVVQVMLVFCVCIAILGFIFVPKIVHLHGLGRSPSSNVRASPKAERSMSSSKNMRFQSFMSSIRQSGVSNDTVAHIRAAAQASMRVSITDLPVKSAEGTETSPDTEDVGTEISERV